MEGFSINAVVLVLFTVYKNNNNKKQKNIIFHSTTLH